ncbi:MAG: DHHA1 domain-containing protein, partial [Evtepia sp.]
YDICACCAPHVRRTGEVGAIKILDYMRHRGGTRMRVVCGDSAIADYRKKHESISEICALLSAKPEHCTEAVKRILGELQAQKNQNAALASLLLQEKIKQIPDTEGHLCLFEPNFNTNQLRELVNGGMTRCSGICAAFAGSDEMGYRYVIGSRHVNVGALSKEINRTLQGKGGGLPEMIQGSVAAKKGEIETYFAKQSIG